MFKYICYSYYVHNKLHTDEAYNYDDAIGEGVYIYNILYTYDIYIIYVLIIENLL